jgi:hypothetical protein
LRDKSGFFRNLARLPVPERHCHRDIKPGNIMLLHRKNRWTLIDFGTVAAIGELAGLSFTLHYTAPEAVEAWARPPGMPVRLVLPLVHVGAETLQPPARSATRLWFVCSQIGL